MRNLRPSGRGSRPWLPALLMLGIGGSALGQPPVSGFTQTLLQRQNNQARQQNSQTPQVQPPQQGASPPAPIPLDWMETWKPETKPRDWKFIVLHHSASLQGSVAGIHELHRNRVDAQGLPWRGIAYHFVIGNGQGMPDGKIEATFRWQEQLEGAHAGDENYNQQGIGICLIGNFEEHHPTEAQLRAVERLVSLLKRDYRIAAEQVVGHGRVKPTQCPGKYFPMARVARMLPPQTVVQGHERSRLVDEDAPKPTAAIRR